MNFFCTLPLAVITARKIHKLLTCLSRWHPYRRSRTISSGARYKSILSNMFQDSQLQHSCSPASINSLQIAHLSSNLWTISWLSLFSPRFRLNRGAHCSALAVSLSLNRLELNIQHPTTDSSVCFFVLLLANTHKYPYHILGGDHYCKTFSIFMKFSISLGTFLQMSQPYQGFWVLWNGDIEQWAPGAAHTLYQNLPDESIL